MVGNQVDVSGTILEPPPGLDPDCLLFLGDPERKTYSTLFRMWMPVTACLAVTAGSFLSNVGARLPIRAGFYRHLFMAALGYGIGEGAWRSKQAWESERDIQYFHYMVLHPEDFQAPEKRKWANVLEDWTPHR